ncbi:hypothetical protein Tco_0449552, partial [Tanacetum coccineum]
LVNYRWIGRHFGDQVRSNPQITLDAIVDLVMNKYNCIVSRNQCRNAKAFVLNEGDAAIQDHYGYLRSYAKATTNSNEGSTIKKPNIWEILTTIGKDGNNYIFLVAWVIVTIKNKDNWSRFLDLLADDLDVPNGNGLTLKCRVVFNDGRIFNLGKFNKKRGDSSSTCHLKMRGGKPKSGRLIPAQRLGRMGAWLGMDAAISDTIENSEPLDAPLLALPQRK